MRKVTKNADTMRMRSVQKVAAEISFDKQADCLSPFTIAFNPFTMVAKDAMNIKREKRRIITPMVSSLRVLDANK